MAEFLTEKQIKKKWCPATRAAYIDSVSLKIISGVNRVPATDSGGQEIKINDRCIGSDCGAWEEGPDIEKTDGTTQGNTDPNGRIKLVNTGRCGLKENTRK